MDAKSKANHLADTFMSKYNIGEAEVNHYTEIVPSLRGKQVRAAPLTKKKSAEGAECTETRQRDRP